MSSLTFRVDGREVEVVDDGASLLEVLRDRLGLRSAKDGCSPQGQCGCCTVLVDGSPRVSCVTPARRVAGREVTTLEGLGRAARWADAFCATGGSQCGFCTPGIIMRLDALAGDIASPPPAGKVNRALAAHLCRCTGWQTIHESVDRFLGSDDLEPMADRDRAAAEERAEIEGGTPQRVHPDVALGGGGFADDGAPASALVAVPDGAGGWSVGETLTEARGVAGKVQGRRTTVSAAPPLELPHGDWDLALRTSWVEPAYLETDASWCEPGGEPASPLANGGAFGGKLQTPTKAAARELADHYGRAVRVLLSREDVVRLGPKRPPIAAGVRADGTGTMRVVCTPGIVEAVASVAPELLIEEVKVPGPVTSAAIRGAGWVEAAVLLTALAHRAEGVSRSAARASAETPAGAWAVAEITAAGDIDIRVRCGRVLDAVVLRSYCIGAAHQALGWVASEGLAVDTEGEVHDLTVRSFGILRSAEMPRVAVEIETDEGPPVPGSDAVLVAVAAAAWLARDCPTDWPAGPLAPPPTGFHNDPPGRVGSKPA